MTIAFTHIPANLRVPGTFFDFQPNANTAQQTIRTLIIGQVLSGTPYAAAGTIGTPQISMGVADAQANAGYGSMLALMVQQYRARDSFGEVWVLPIADDGAAVAASGTVTFTGPATATGTLPLYINATPIPVLVTATNTASQIATAVVAAVTAQPGLPVTAAAAAGVVTFTAKNKGLAGNDIDIRFAYAGPAAGEAIPAGVGETIVAMSGGATNPSLTTPLLALADMRFEVIISPYTDANSLASLAALMDDNTGRWSWQRKLYGHVYAALKANLAAASTFGATVNNQHLTVLPMNGCPLWTPQIAADYAAAVTESVRVDPSIPLQYLPTNIPAPAPQSRFVVSDRNTLLFDGLSTYKVVQGVVEVERLVTTYQLNPAGVVDTSYLDAETMHTLGYIARDLDSYLTTKFARMKLTADNTRIPGGTGLVNPAVIKATLDTRYRYLCEVPAVAQNADGFAAQSRVELAGNGRVNIYAPVDVMGQLRVLALSVAFTKTT